MTSTKQTRERAVVPRELERRLVRAALAWYRAWRRSRLASPDSPQQYRDWNDIESIERASLVDIAGKLHRARLAASRRKR